MTCGSCSFGGPSPRACGMMSLGRRSSYSRMKLGKKSPGWWLWLVVILLVLLVVFWIGRALWKGLLTPGNGELPDPKDVDVNGDGEPEVPPPDDPLVPDPVEGAVYGVSWFFARGAMRSGIIDAILENLQQQAAEMSRPLSRQDIANLRDIVQRAYGQKIACFVAELEKAYPESADAVGVQLRKFNTGDQDPRFTAVVRSKARICGINIDQIEALARGVLRDYFNSM